MNLKDIRINLQKKNKNKNVFQHALLNSFCTFKKNNTISLEEAPHAIQHAIAMISKMWHQDYESELLS